MGQTGKSGIHFIRWVGLSARLPGYYLPRYSLIIFPL
jgi:hypothetical protein